MPAPVLKRLPNGLPILTVPMMGTASVTVLAMVNIGSRYETKSEQGMSHLLEHMLFKGSAKWPTAKDIAQTLDSVGADYNAFTAKDQTGYYVKVAHEHLPLAIDIVADMIWRPKLDAAELNCEKKVICEEIKMYEDNPLMHIGDLLESEIFRGSSLGINIAGSIKSVTALNRTQLDQYHRRYYRPRNLLVVAAGKLTAAAGRRLRAKFSEPWPGQTGSFTPFKVSQATPRVVIQRKPTQQVQLALGFPSYGYRHKNRLGLDLLALVLGGNMSSRLFMRLREREGLCYSIGAAAEQYEGAGALTVQAGLDTSRLTMAIRLIREELERVVAEPISAAELTKAKEYIRGKLTLAMENSSAQAHWAAKQYLFEHTRESLSEFLARVSRVRVGELSRAARDVISFKRANLALIGPCQDAKRWQRLVEP